MRCENNVCDIKKNVGIYIPTLIKILTQLPQNL